MVKGSKYPFWFHGLIRDPGQLFDRDREKARLELYLTKGMSCQIVGPPAIGKSSLLYNLQAFARNWDRRAKVAYLDLQDPAYDSVSSLYRASLVGWGETEVACSSEELSRLMQDWRSRGVPVVLCLDEFATLTRKPDEFTVDFYSGLRALGQKGLTIFTSARCLLAEIVPTYILASSFFNIFALLRVGPFSEDDAHAFVRLHREGVPKYSTDEEHAIVDFANGHPLALQIACFYVLLAKENDDNLNDAITKAREEMTSRSVKW
jgi:hypothetical protein